jgi:dTDP-4-dehydrorhamnose reductase/SAM-dependent methyltransferase
MSHTIVIFGGTGMLGNYCLNILQQEYNVISITRKDYDIMDNNYDKLFNIINSYNNSVIINCAGSIPQRGINNEMDCFITNSLFPKMLDKIAYQLKIKFIHISTNCVFNFTNGNCDELVMPNETKSYGLSKILGEAENACVIRTSIIGEELANKKSLLEWVLSNKNGNINGYTNYLWNGCSCLTLVKFIKSIIDTDTYWKGVKHIHSMETISKYELVCMINEIYNLNINITPIELDNTINKTLSSIYDNTVITKSIKEQIIEQKNIDFKLGTYHTITKCRCCNNINLKKIWELKNTPLAGGFLKNIKDVIHERHYPLTLLYCDNCYSAFVKEIIMENKLFTNINNNGYFYYSSQIPTLVEHFKNLYNYVKTNYNLNEKKIMEIGCNDGVFLNNFSKTDNLKYLIGIDPSETIQKINDSNIIKINDFFNSKNVTQIIKEYGKMDYVVACNCLAHIDDINDIFKNIKLILNDDGIIIMEVHYVKNICESMNFDFIYHEHMSYYSINGIYNICKNNNLNLDNVEHITNHGGSIRITIKNKINTSNIYYNPLLSNTLQQEDISPHMDTFLDRINKWKIEINSIINDVYEKEQIVAGYGASGRTNILLTVMQKKFDFIFDDSNSKINNFIPLFHTQILNSNEIYNNNIKTVFLLAWTYSKYIIQKHIKFIKNGGRFIIILPEIKEININNINNYLNI